MIKAPSQFYNLVLILFLAIIAVSEYKFNKYIGEIISFIFLG